MTPLNTYPVNLSAEHVGERVRLTVKSGAVIEDYLTEVRHQARATEIPSFDGPDTVTLVSFTSVSPPRTIGALDHYGDPYFEVDQTKPFFLLTD